MVDIIDKLAYCVYHIHKFSDYPTNKKYRRSVLLNMIDKGV